MNPAARDIIHLRTDIERTDRTRKKIRISAVIITLFILVYSALRKNISETVNRSATLIFWILSLLIISGLFFMEVHYLKRNKEREWEIYQIDLTELEDRKKLFRIRPEMVSDYQLERTVQAPEAEIRFPVLFYAILFSVSLLGGILLLF